MGLLKSIGKVVKKVTKGVGKVALPILGMATGGLIGGLGAEATAATALKGAAIGGLLGYGMQSQNQAVDTQQQQYETSMAQQERLSNSAHQREVADMRAAGINPILTATGGSGATSPAVTAGSLPQWYNDDGHSALQTLLQDRMLKSQIESLDAQSALNRTNAWVNASMLPINMELGSAQAYAHRMDADTNRLSFDVNKSTQSALRDYYISSGAHSAGQARWQNLQNNLFEQQLPAYIVKAEQDKHYRDSLLGQFMSGFRNVGSDISSIIGLGTSAVNGAAMLEAAGANNATKMIMANMNMYKR